MWQRVEETVGRAGTMVRDRWSSLGRRERIVGVAGAGAIVALAAVGVSLGLFFALRGGDDHCDKPLCVEVIAPAGDDVPPMTPVRIRLAGALDRDAAIDALQISNQPEGEKGFEGDVLTFRPAWPGFARGERYDVALQLASASIPEGADPVDVSYRFTTAGKLEITSVFPPDGAVEIALDGAVMVQFNRSVAPLSVISERGPAGIVDFEPPVAGEGRWLNTSLFTFRPAPGWAPSTTYRATLKAGLANRLGSRLEADRVFTFSTLSPGVAQILPADNSTFVSPTPEIAITFNQPVERASAEAAFSLTREGGAGVGGTFEWKDDISFIFRSSAPLALASGYNAAVHAGVRSKDATAVSTVEARSRFETVGLPRVASTTPANGDQRAQPYGVGVVFSNPMDQRSVEDAFVLSPEPEFPLYFYWDEGSLRMDVSVAFDPSTAARFAIGVGAKDRYGQALPALDVSFVTQPRESGFSIFRSGMTGTFNAYLDPTFIVSSWNVDQLDFELYRADRDVLIGFERGETQFSPTPDQRIRTWSEAIPGPPLDTAVTTAVRLAAPGERLPQGIYYFRMSAPGSAMSDAMPFVVSSANVTTKWTDDELLIWAVDMQTGDPIGGLPFDVLSENASVIASGTTGDDGVARVGVESADYVYPGYYVAAQRGDLTVLAGTNWTGSIGYPNLPYIFKPERYAGHLYTDRPIYRPGESVEIKGIARADDDARYGLPPADTEFRLQINDAQGREVFNDAVAMSDVGSFSATLPLSDQASTGQYYVTLSYVVSRSADSPPGLELRGFSNLQFRVAEFRKPEFEVEVTTDKDSYTNGEAIKATARASLFFGATLAGAKVEWQVTTQAYAFSSETFPQHSFGDYERDAYYYGEGPFFEPQQRIRLQGSGVLDESGAITVDLPADVASDPSSQTFVFEATVTDQNGQSVGAFTGVPVHKGAFYLGLRPEEYVSFAGEEASVSIVSVDPDDSVVPRVPATITIFERTWRTVRERTSDGEQRFVSEPEDKLVETRQVTTGDDGTASFGFTPKKSGEHRIVATARDNAGNEIRSSTSTWASGNEFASWRIGNDDLIQLVADKAEYASGETAKVLVGAPFSESTGLVTQERGRLMSYEIREFPTNSQTIEIPITSDHIPNVYVSVALFKAPTAENPRPQAKYGIVELRVSTDEKKLAILIGGREHAGPREKVTYKITTTNSAGEGVPAEVSLALVDKSVLSLQDDFARPSIEAFWSRRPLSVLTGSMFAYSIDRANELTIDRLRGGGKGGGGGSGDESRTFFPNTAYWDPDLRTDANGEATVEIELPDTLTTWRMTARGITLDTVAGEARSEIVTSKDVIVRPAVPRFLVADDRASLGAIVHNFTDSGGEFAVRLSGEGIEIDGDETQRVSIDAGADALVRWNTHVPPGSESVSLKFEASGGDDSDAVSLDLTVYAYVTPETVGTAGEVTDEAFESVEVPYYVRPDDGELTVRVSPSLASGVDTALDYVLEYPWESAETTVSRFLPRLALDRAVSELGLTDIDEGGDSSPLVRRSLQRLYNNQNSDGGFGWWPDDESDPAVTAYALVGFGEAKRGGHAVDTYVEENAATYLLGQLDLPRDVIFPQYDLRAFMLYALARSGRGDLGRTMALAEQRANLSNTAKAWIAIAIGDALGSPRDPRLTSLMSDLESAGIASATGNHWEDGVYAPEVFGDSTQATAQVLQAFTRYQPDHPLVDGTLRWLMVARKDGHWESTHDTALALLAITDFMIVRKDAQADFRYRVSLNGDEHLDGRAKKGELHQDDAVVIDMKDLLKDTVNELRLERTPADAAGRLYYTAHLRYFTPAENIEAMSYGIGVSHEYFLEDAEGDAPISEVALGDVVRVRVTLVAESDLNFVVLEDYLPAGLEPIDTTLKTTPPELQRRLYEEQRRSYQVSKRYSPFGHTDIRDNRVALFARFVPKGVYEYTYFAQATTPGEFRVAPATVYEQYFPEVWGRSDGSAFVVREATDASARTLAIDASGGRRWR